LTFEKVQAEPDRYVGNLVIWGGVIIETVNRQEGTYIKVLQTPLVSGEEPRDSETSRGRFLLRHTSYLDSEIYKKGRKLSVAGKIIGKEILPIGEVPYTYPLIMAEELHLWKEQKPDPWDDYYYHHPHYWDYYDWDFYGPRLLFRRYPGAYWW
jgi:outer membrane lipoprotein